MKVAVLAGGKGERLSEEKETKPKPLVEIGGRPILWHIMKYYAYYGFKDFVIAVGLKGDVVKEYIATVGSIRDSAKEHSYPATATVFRAYKFGWMITLVDTGISTKTGGRIKRIAPYLQNETFMLTWCDGVSDVNLSELLTFHRSHGKLATLTAVHPPERFGLVELDGDRVKTFFEKPKATDRWVNGAFFVLEPGVFDYIEGDDTQWEKGPLQRLAEDGQLMAHRHAGFWQCMDTVYEKRLLNTLWKDGRAPWKVWK